MMDLSRFKKGNDKQAWLDWLSDDAPSPQAQADIRRRHVQRANSYQPRQFTPQSGSPVPPVAAQQAPGTVRQTQPQPQAFRSAAAPTAPPVRPQSTAGQGSGVSIQINIPQLQLGWLRRFKARIGGFFGHIHAWYLDQLAEHMGRTMALSALSVLIVAGLIAGPFLHIGSKASHGTAAVSAPSVKYKKPTFKVVVPANKPKLATPDGVHASFDGNRDSYSYSDSIGSNGFIVSEQPLPDKFNTADEAISKIGPQIYGPTGSGHTVSTNTGDAYITVSSKGAQTVVFSVNNLLMFIQSSHKFSDTDIQDYINSLQ